MKLPLHRDLAARLERELHAAIDWINQLQALHALGREHTCEADGYPHGSGFTDGSRATDATSSTERAALTPTDHSTRVLSDAIEHFLAGSKHLAASASKLAEYRTPRTPPEPGRVNSTVVCAACGDLALPRVISGYDPKCYEAWRAAGFPDRSEFERTRRTRAQRTDGAA